MLAQRTTSANDAHRRALETPEANERPIARPIGHAIIVATNAPPIAHARLPIKSSANETPSLSKLCNTDADALTGDCSKRRNATTGQTQSTAIENARMKSAQSRNNDLKRNLRARGEPVPLLHRRLQLRRAN